ncbi:MAG TPA: sigma-70 family RNA polymerase sigma factor [Pirellulales bacterium]
MVPTPNTYTGPYEAFDDDALVARLKSGEGTAFDAFVRRFAGPMLAVARRVLSNEEDARESLQDAFLQAFRAVPRFEGRSSLATWLRTIVLNAAIEKLRRRKRRPEQSIEAMLPQFAADGHHADDPTPWRTSATDVAERKELQQLVLAGIDALPEAYRTVLLLRDIEGLDTAETAKLLDTSTGVVKTRLHRARLALRNLLEPQFREEAV